MNKRLLNNKYWLIAEALAQLVWAHCLIWCLPFRSIVARFNEGDRLEVNESQLRNAQIALVVRMTEKASRILPWRIVCFPKALAVGALLRRRNIIVTLYLGAMKKPSQKLQLHAWLQDGERGVLGYSNINQYRVLVRYPSE